METSSQSESEPYQRFQRELAKESVDRSQVICIDQNMFETNHQFTHYDYQGIQWQGPNQIINKSRKQMRKAREKF